MPPLVQTARHPRSQGMSKRRLTEEEKKAWDRVRQSVRPLKQGGSAKTAREVSGQPLLKSGNSGPATGSRGSPVRTGLKMDYHRTGSGLQNRAAEKRIRRGKVEVSSSFDLHGHTQASAWSALPAFLMREQARGSRCVIVITGKGKLGEGVLRQNFLRWLEMPEARTLVSGYAQAHPRHGGAGAFYVFLRRR